MTEIENIQEENPKNENLKSENVNENISQRKNIEQNPESKTPNAGGNEQLQTENYKLQTEQMEVHHHPKVEKKSFKEYLLEGLMIFLAVTLGFFAENIREHITAHKKAEIFTASMKDDLRADTAQLNAYNRVFKNAANSIDTFMQLLTVDDIKNIPSGKLYWYGLLGGQPGSFVPNDATFQQMKSSGSIGLFKAQTANDIEKYDRFCRSLQTYEEMQRNIYTEVRKARAQIFEFKYNAIVAQLHQSSTFSQASIDSFMASNPPLLSQDKILFNQYVELVRSRFIRLYNVAYSDSLIKQANIVLKDLNNDFK